MEASGCGAMAYPRLRRRDRRDDPPGALATAPREAPAARLLARACALPPEERPRERLARLGPEALSVPELLAALFVTGTKESSALRVGETVLAAAGGLRGLGDLDIYALSGIAGIGRGRGAQLLAALELGRRVSTATRERRAELRSPADVHRLLAGMRYLDREHFKVLLLDTKNRLLGIETVAVGTLNASLIHPREVFKPAIRRSAASVILAHNHPTGSPSPSPEDVEITRRFADSGRIVGIEILDHIIIGECGFESLREAGVL